MSAGNARQVTQREYEAVTELAADIFRVWDAVRPFVTAVAGTAAHMGEDERRRENLGIVRALAERAGKDSP